VNRWKTQLDKAVLKTLYYLEFSLIQNSKPKTQNPKEPIRRAVELIIKTRAYARVGLIGNPSDGYFGKTISSAITNFSAEVMLWESPRLQVILHDFYDPTEFDSLADLEHTANRDGYYGGYRLILATCKKFSDHCRRSGFRLDDKNFTIQYNTNIPRQVGLGGSSAIITAAMKALMGFYGLTEKDIPREILPNMILGVETEELDIRAGLQDRVIQVYGGTVYMDFSEEIMKETGRGRYEILDFSLLPPLFLAYIKDPSFSGHVHSNLSVRFKSGEREVVEAMRTFAHYTVQAKEALLKKDHKALADLMNKNFDLRRKILGDRIIGPKNLKMIEIARTFGLSGKFAGSGGGVIGMYETEEQHRRLETAYRENGFEFVRASIDPGTKVHGG